MRDLTVEYISDKYTDGIEYSDTDEEERKNTNIKRNILFVPEYQREFTWDEKRSSKLIESILLGLPIPFIFVAENGDGAWEIVDGSQRVRAIHAFIENSLVLTGLESLTNANGITFNDLESSRKGKFLDTALRFIILSEETTDDIKKDMFERINRGSDLLKPMEKRKGIYTGPFTKFIYDYVETSKSFSELVEVDKWLEKRQEKQELLLRFFALSESKKYQSGISGSLADFLDNYLDNKNKELSLLNPEKLEKKLSEYKNQIDSVNNVVKNIFPYGYRHRENPQTKRSVFEAISIGIYMAIMELGSNLNFENYNKEEIYKNLIDPEFKKNTHVANQSHKQQKLAGRINYIRDMLVRK